MDDLESAWFASLARDLVEQHDHDLALRRIADVAIAATGCSAAGIARPVGRGLVFDYASDMDLLTHVFRILRDTGQGPAPDAIRSGYIILVADIAADTRWPAYRDRIIAETPIRSLLACGLALNGAALGALVLYSDQAGYFTDSRLQFATIYARHAAIALSRIADQSRIDNLELALRSNRTIGAAMGIAIATLGVTMDEAFDLLRLASQNGNRKLSALAADIVAAGDISPITTIADRSARRRAAAAQRQASIDGATPTRSPQLAQLI